MSLEQEFETNTINTDDLHSSISNTTSSETNTSSLHTITSNTSTIQTPTESIEDGEGELENVPGYSSKSSLESGQLLDDDSKLLDAEFALQDPSLTTLISSPTIQDNIREVVIGVDDRVQIRNTNRSPWKMICSLNITANDGSRWLGTGWLAGRRTIITAGHCVYLPRRGGWVRQIEVIPARNGSQRPHGSINATSFRSVRGWTQSGNRAYDYGAIILPSSNAIGARLGYFGILNTSTINVRNKWANLAGYPGDKPSGTLWYHGRRVKSVSSRSIVYDIDTAGGQSGACVWTRRGSRRLVYGIHTTGSPRGNSATRITTPVYNNLRRWAQE